MSNDSQPPTPNQNPEQLPTVIPASLLTQSGGVNFGQGNWITIDGNVIGTQILQAIPAGQLPPALHQVRPPRADFTGRDAILRQLIAAVDRGAAVIGLFGMGGVGKTELAYKLVEHLERRFPDAQLYLDLHGVGPQPLSRQAILAHVIRSFNPLAELPDGLEALQADYRTALHGRCLMLLLDNARDADQVSGLDLPPSCLLLLTSRQRFYLPGLVDFDLGSLEPAEAEAFLVRIAPRIAPRIASRLAGQAEELARLCGYLPLALSLTGSALQQRRDLPVADYLQRLQDVERRLELTGVEANLRLSYDLLAGELQLRWATLSAFPAGFSHAAAAAVWELDQAAGREILSQLLLESLLEYDEVADRYRLHDMARLVAQKLCPPEESLASRRRHAQVYLDILRQANRMFVEGQASAAAGLRLFDLEWENFQAGQSWAAMMAEQDPQASALCKDYPAAGATLLDLRRPPRQLILWMEAAIAACQRLDDLEGEAEYRARLGLVYANLGEAGLAIRHQKDAMAILRRSGNMERYWVWYGSLGSQWLDQGQPEKALFLFDLALDAAREAGDRSLEGLWLANMGIACHQQGEHSQALEYMGQSLEIARELNDTQEEVHRLGNIGAVHLSLHDYPQASACLNKALEIARQIDDRRSQADQLANLGLVHRLQGQIELARDAWSQALAIFREYQDPRADRVESWLNA